MLISLGLDFLGWSRLWSESVSWLRRILWRRVVFVSFIEAGLLDLVFGSLPALPLMELSWLPPSSCGLENKIELWVMWTNDMIYRVCSANDMYFPPQKSGVLSPHWWSCVLSSCGDLPSPCLPPLDHLLLLHDWLFLKKKLGVLIDPSSGIWMFFNKCEQFGDQRTADHSWLM